jgi:hypothetical protein
MKIELNVPDNLSEITLKQYQKYNTIATTNEDATFITQKMIEIFCNVSLANIVSMKATTINELMAHFKKIFEEPRAFVQRFTIEGIEFGFIPNLEEISFEEYVDIEANITDVNKLHKALSILYRPIKERKKDLYTIESKDRGKDFTEVLKYTPLNIALSAQVFFWTLGLELLRAIPSYLEVQTRELQTIPQKDNLASSGDGITQSMTSLTEILQSLTKLQGKDYRSALHY